MSGSHEKRNLIIAGLIIGVIAGFLVLAGNPGTVHSPRNYWSYFRGLCIVHDSWRTPK